MVRSKTMTLVEAAELVSAAFDFFHADVPEELRGGRLFRSALMERFKDRFGEDWTKAWNHVANRQDRTAPLKRDAA